MSIVTTIVQSRFLPFSDEQLQQFETSFGDIRVVRGAVPPTKRWAPNVTPEPPWEAVFRVPTEGESNNFEGAAHNERAKPAALRNLAKATVVAVSLNGAHTVWDGELRSKAHRDVQNAWEDLRVKFPGAHMAAQDDIMQLAGMSAEIEGKE